MGFGLSFGCRKIRTPWLLFLPLETGGGFLAARVGGDEGEPCTAARYQGSDLPWTDKNSAWVLAFPSVSIRRSVLLCRVPPARRT